MEIKKIARSALEAVSRRLKNHRYARDTVDGKPAGTFAYQFAGDGPTGHLPLTLWCRAVDSRLPTRAEAKAWIDQQTLPELVIIGLSGAGDELWRVSRHSAPKHADSSFWFAAPGKLPDLLPNHLESSFLVAAAEDVDAVLLFEGSGPYPELPAHVPGVECASPYRERALYRSDAYAYHAATDEVRPVKEQRIIKLIDPRDAEATEATARLFNRFRRGPYLSTTELTEKLIVPVRDAGLVERDASQNHLPAVLIMVPFLARGGVEQTLYATMGALSDRFDFSIATLAPHREALGDRRDDFRTITDRIYCLGDLVHPDVMIGIIESILDSTGAEIIYNANGTTLFYDFAARLKENRPSLRIIDHLYDHEVAYIDRYNDDLLAAVDVCVAENHLIADELTRRRSWPAERVPVIWPCGRPQDELPEPADRPRIRTALRGELDLAESDVVVITAARMNHQKRPLDLVRLAERVHDLEHLQFLVVGGGDLEMEMDREIAGNPELHIRRLPFRPDIPELILAADAGCLVSEFEGLPVFMLECLQLGRPFLGTRVGDLGRVLDQTGAGIVVDQPGDLDALEAAVRRLADSSFRAELAQKAVEAAPRFSVERCADAYSAAFLGDD